MLGLGVDIIKISRMTEILSRSGQLFLDRVFTDMEQKAGQGHHYPDAYYAMTFAAKEAVFKSFGIDWSGGVDFKDIEISRGRLGEPLVNLGRRPALLAGKRTRVLLSLSYDGDTAIAVATISKHKGIKINKTGSTI